MTAQNRKFISVSAEDADLNLLHFFFFFGRGAQKRERNVKSIVATVFH